MPRMAAAFSAVARACSGVAAVMLSWPILRPRWAGLPYRCRWVPGRARTWSQAGSAAVSPLRDKPQVAQQVQHDGGLCWRGCTERQAVMVRTCGSNCDTSKAFWL